ncbi:hypothetical protein EDB81DRAFT_934282 [Dactylonectria macrodidyma]|uniref:Uncharacterized protein n=1 Tax=Dactylonectria macrodidyma TaxID=307937 RepID=A0A9P9J429_9HYPO|nr:hypothetical protein EDB81DRAFT_934282 [Dactylonectria macrodidyma]
MPIPGGTDQFHLIEVLERNPSLYELCQELPLLADKLQELDRNPVVGSLNIQTYQTVSHIRQDPLVKWPVVILLHSMGRDAIRSVIMGTVAYDDHRQALWYPDPQPGLKEAGIYVLGLACSGQNGQFLNNKELALLVEGLGRYRLGSAILKSNPNTTDATEQGHIKWVNKVDSAFQSSDKRIAFFNTKASDDKIIVELATRLHLRITGLDLTGDVRHHQSPLYVGCSTDLWDRFNNYKLKRLSRINKSIGLTLSVLRALGVDMDLVSRVVIRTWEVDQLSLAERLVTTLAGSLICQTGFNTTQAGSQTGKDISSATLADGKKAVDKDRTFLFDNVSLTLETMDDRDEQVQLLADLNEALDSLAGKIGIMEREFKHLDGIPNASVVLQALDRRKLEQEAKLKKLRERLRFAETVYVFKQVILAAYQ